MPYLIREAAPCDAEPVGGLLEAYMQETYQGVWGGSTQLLGRGLRNREVEIVVAETLDREVIGFVAWIDSYDLHWCMRGGEVIDFFVDPAHRGRGAAILLVARLAADVRGRGGVYLKGGAVDNHLVRQFYRKIAMCLPGGESYVSGRAFGLLADLSGKSLRAIVKGLPQTSLNHEP